MGRSSAYPNLLGSAESLSVALGLRDEYTRKHCDRVVRLATALGDACGVVDADIDRLRVCARFHDVGKIGVPDAVLLKPGPLTDEEWILMRAHANFSEVIFRAMNVEQEDEIAFAIRHHHESFDGTGYPDGLRGDEIPLLSRIMLVVDAYDAITTKRSYSEARSHTKTMEILESEAGHKTDPQVFGKFVKVIEHSSARAAD
jgi:HD-GYP domain-containing protein (c-di-GMP phosphodiesterase class II)